MWEIEISLEVLHLVTSAAFRSMFVFAVSRCCTVERGTCSLRMGRQGKISALGFLNAPGGISLKYTLLGTAFGAGIPEP